MEIDQILGRVSPLKARGGKYAGIATGTASIRGGYSESTSGSNRGGYNTLTRFKAEDEWMPPPSGGIVGPVAPSKFTMRANPFYRNYGIGGEPKKK
jgi:hypothetical protein